MRQKLIKKVQKSSAKKGRKEAVQLTHVEENPLEQLLFGQPAGREQWVESLKKHSSTVANILLNNDLDAFNAYLKSNLGGIASSKSLSNQAKQSSLLLLDEKKFLQEFLQLAVLIEHSTIPPYLTAMYSIKDGTNALPIQIIRSVVVEEMLHMIMVCNVLNALGIVPSVNKPQNYPSYPVKLPLNVDFYVGLEKFSTNSIATFIAIESPSSPTVEAPSYEPEEESALLTRKARGEAADYWTSDSLMNFLTNNVNTIGEFYDVLFFFIVLFQTIDYYKRTGKMPTSFKDINKGGLFTGDPALQIGPEQYYGSGGTLYSVVDLEGVMEVFKEIKGQGEGADDTIFSIDPSQFGEGHELAHYFRFKEIFHEHFYLGGNYDPFKDENGQMPVTTPPTGRALKVDWNAAYPVKPNVKMSDLAGDSQLYAQGKEFNATYKRLLDAIQAAVEGRPEEIEKSVMYMYALKEQAIELMRQPLNGQENAGPTFEYPSN